MRIYYHLSDYISHRRAGEDYIACLRLLGHSITDNPAESDLVIIHEGPHYYSDILQGIPRRTGRKIIGYGVWETPRLPPAYIEGARAVDAVWTCSEFSRQAFAPYAEAHVLPHVVTRGKPSREDIAMVSGRIGLKNPGRGTDGLFYFYTIADTVNPRKNIATLLAAFNAAFPDEGDRVRLVVKQYRFPQDLSAFRNVIDLPEDLSGGQISALHALGDACVSAHHAEAWGLPLSEALSFGNPVIATGYSGNMEFMTPENSFPVPYSIAPVSEAMCRALPGLFSRDMTWADIDPAALARIMRAVRSRPPDSSFRARAAASMEKFSPAAVSERLRALLELV